MEHTIKSSKTFRYYTLGDFNKGKTLLFVLHGYGQLAKYFIQKFNFLPEDYFIVAPEGMHRFYLNGSAGRVGASWMTKEDRENDILDNLNWLEDLYTEFKKNKKFDKIIILGFSQGGATAARWFYKNRNNFDHLIMWATVFPPDLNVKLEITPYKNEKNYFALGTSDEFYDDVSQLEILEFYSSLGFTPLTFNGKHDINQMTVETILSSIHSIPSH